MWVTMLGSEVRDEVMHVDRFGRWLESVGDPLVVLAHLLDCCQVGGVLVQPGDQVV